MVLDEARQPPVMQVDAPYEDGSDQIKPENGKSSDSSEAVPNRRIIQ